MRGRCRAELAGYQAHPAEGKYADTGQPNRYDGSGRPVGA